ncbi:hypothetical protein B0H17DRAFT_1199222 [Mycena rosella]|uniref:Uncharacterized protein n=1 Tax=Mycena rosella TaxID=1033263 RepID=A0AAD7GJY2_MYCRO|nr:hypothetical protein B0H17DRAFT_1199222 [Mycena rosella]
MAHPPFTGLTFPSPFLALDLRPRAYPPCFDPSAHAHAHACFDPHACPALTRDRARPALTCAHNLPLHPWNPYIDNRANVDDERMQEDGPENDGDDTEARREAALDAPYRIPQVLLHSKALPPISALLQPAQMPVHTPQSPAGTPSFFAGPSTFEQACDHTPLFLPGSRGPTPYTYRTPTPFSGDFMVFPQAGPRERTPLFLPDSRGPTPYSFCTPTPFAPLPQAGSGPPTSPLPIPQDGPAEFLDLEASDSDEDDEEEEDAIVLTQQDLDFINDVPLPESVRPLERPIQRRDIMDSEQLAEHYDQQAASYLQDMEVEEQDFVPLSDTAQDLTRDPELQRAIEHVVRETMPKPAPTLPPREIAPESATHTAFRLKRLLPATSKDAVEIGTWIRFRESRKSKPVLAFTVANNQVLLKREMVRFPRPLLKANNPCVFPTIEEVAPFLGAFNEFRAVMTAARFIGPAFALQPGDRAIVLPPAGTLAGADVWITQIQDFVHQGSDRYTPLRGALIEGKDVVRLAHVSPHYRGDNAVVYRGDNALVKGGARGAWHPLNLLKRHVLCPSPPPRILDRVRVTGAHRGMDGGVAWIVQIQDIPEIPSGQMIMVKGEDNEMFEIELSKLRREFRLGDEVVVARSDLKSRKGFVTVIHPGAVLEIFDGATGNLSMAESKESSEFVVAHTVYIPTNTARSS